MTEPLFGGRVVADRAGLERYMPEAATPHERRTGIKRMSQPNDNLTHRRKRALYRAEHRGTKEMDWLLGRYARAELEGMSEDDLSTFEQLLVLPDPDLENWIMGAAADLPGGEIGAFILRLRRFHGLET